MRCKTSTRPPGWNPSLGLLSEPFQIVQLVKEVGVFDFAILRLSHKYAQIILSERDDCDTVVGEASAHVTFVAWGETSAKAKETQPSFTPTEIIAQLLKIAGPQTIFILTFEDNLSSVISQPDG